MSCPIKTFDEFWHFYLREHRRPATRALHYGGTGAIFVTVAAAAAVSWWLLPLVPFVGYGPAWAGHFFVEHNRPASFRYRRWSVLADFKMFLLFLTGRLGPHLREAEKVGDPAVAAARELAAAAPP